MANSSSTPLGPAFAPTPFAVESGATAASTAACAPAEAGSGNAAVKRVEMMVAFRSSVSESARSAVVPPSPAALGAVVATAVVASGVVSEAAEAAPGAEHPARTTTPARAAVPRASRETGIR